MSLKMDDLLTAKAKIEALPAFPVLARANLKTWDEVAEALGPGRPALRGIIRGLPCHSDPMLCDGVIKIEWSDGRTETIDVSPPIDLSPQSSPISPNRKERGPKE